MIKNFLFHRVNPERDRLWDPMDVELFDKCIAHISKKYKVVKIEDLPSLSERKNIATICFDDGFKDNITYALPILEKYKVKASFYVVTNCIDKNIPTWTFNLEYLFSNSAKETGEIKFSFLPDELNSGNLLSRDEKINYVKKLKPALKLVTHSQRQQVLSYFFDKLNDVIVPQIMMNWDDLKKLMELGHTIGSHTLSHPMLASMENENEIEFELEESRKTIYNKLGIWPQTISYPVGSYNEKVKLLSKKAGYKIGLAVKQREYYTAKDDVFEIPRIELYNEPWWKTRLRINGSLERIKRIILYR